MTGQVDKLNVLVAAGEVSMEHDNEHRSFRLHTSLLTTVLESTGRFRVRVLEEFRGVGDELLDRFDVVLVMYEGRRDYFSVPEGFGKTTNDAFLRFVRDKGRGMVWFHSSAPQDEDWGYPEEFNEMRGAVMSSQRGLRRRPVLEDVVRTVDPRHPITNGLPAQWSVTNDDMLTGTVIHPGTQVLLTVFDDAAPYRAANWPPPNVPVELPPGGLDDLLGMNTDQPLAWINEWGAGRCFTLILGHDVDTFRREPFMTVLTRGVEWAASGQVTLSPPTRTGEHRLRMWPYYAGDTSRWGR